MRELRAKISARYPIVELVRRRAGARDGLCVRTDLADRRGALGFAWTLLALTLIDLDHKLLPGLADAAAALGRAARQRVRGCSLRSPRA